LLPRHAVGRLQIPLEHLQLLSVIEINNVVRANTDCFVDTVGISLSAGDAVKAFATASIW
jgi:hypothetical protein